MIIDAAAFSLALAGLILAFFSILRHEHGCAASLAGAIALSAVILGGGLYLGHSEREGSRTHDLAVAKLRLDREDAARDADRKAAQLRHMTPAPQVLMRGPDVRPVLPNQSPPASPPTAAPAPSKPSERDA